MSQASHQCHVMSRPPCSTLLDIYWRETSPVLIDLSSYIYNGAARCQCRCCTFNSITPFKLEFVSTVADLRFMTRTSEQTRILFVDNLNLKKKAWLPLHLEDPSSPPRSSPPKKKKRPCRVTLVSYDFPRTPRPMKNPDISPVGPPFVHCSLGYE